MPWRKIRALFDRAALSWRSRNPPGAEVPDPDGSATSLVPVVMNAATEIQQHSESVKVWATGYADARAQQQSALVSASAPLQTIAQTTIESSELADKVIQITERAEVVSREGQVAVERSIGSIEKLGSQVTNTAVAIISLSEQTLKIGEIIAAMKEIADRSNLLALNAAIQASSAGEHGRSFSIVAHEMRQLAQQSREALDNVRKLLQELQQGTRVAVEATETGSRTANETVELARSAGAAIEALARVIQESAQSARQIAGSAQDQASGVEQVLGAVEELSAAMAAVEKQAFPGEQLAAELRSLSLQLQSHLANSQT